MGLRDLKARAVFVGDHVNWTLQRKTDISKAIGSGLGHPLNLV